MPSILIAGGGSGGHVAPAIATAEVLEDRGVHVFLLHSNRLIDKTLIGHTTFEGVVVPAAPFSTSPRGFLRFLGGFLQTSKHVRRFIQQRKIDCLLATGGYVAAPALRGARQAGCPTVLLNLDDPPGKANRLAVRWADYILSTVACSLNNAVLINPPLRQDVIASPGADACRRRLGLDPHRSTLLVTGASQGASTINALVPSLAKQFPTPFMGWQVLHIAGESHTSSVRMSWEATDVPYKVVGFQHAMGDAWGAADLAITRGGANTIAEIALNAVPAVVMPYPYHEDDHQRSNAQHLERIGGVLIATDHRSLDSNIADAGQHILQLLTDHKGLFSMRQSLVFLAPTNGSIEVADTCISCVEAMRME